MKDPQDITRVRFNLYLSTAQATQLRRLFAAGLTISGIARQAISKCSEMPLEHDVNGPFPDRFNFHIALSDAETLEKIAERENCPKAVVLRLLINRYLTVNSSAIDQLF